MTLLLCALEYSSVSNEWGCLTNLFVLYELSLSCKTPNYKVGKSKGKEWNYWFCADD